MPSKIPAVTHSQTVIIHPSGARRKVLLLLPAIFLFCCTSNQPLPPSHHDVVVEGWVGKSKKQLIASMGPPTRETTLSSGESTLIWERKDGCYITFNTDKAGIVESGHDRCTKPPVTR
ncbi:MAG TPA: hypothetical protein VGJ57_01895 [Nitrospirales bacterium]|jgi:hypothetical protein